MRDKMYKQKNNAQTRHNKDDVTLMKLRGTTQYVLYVGGHEINFILEEDAQRFASKITGQKYHPVHEM